MNRGPFCKNVKGLPPLVAPDHLRGRMGRWSPPGPRAEREVWAAAAGHAGYSSAAVGNALGISCFSAYEIMKKGGWDCWAHLRQPKNMEFA